MERCHPLVVSLVDVVGDPLLLQLLADERHYLQVTLRTGTEMELSEKVVGCAARRF